MRETQRQPRSKKKPLVLLLLAIVAMGVFVAGWRWYTAWSASGKIVTGEVSSRGLEFIERQSSQSGSIWQGKQLGVTEAAGSTVTASLSVVVHTACFAFTPPYPVQTIYPSDPASCSALLRLRIPAGQLAITVATFSGQLSDDSAVKLRTSFPRDYTAVTFSHPKFSPAKVFQDKQGVSFFTLVNQQLLSVVFSETTDQDRILSESLTQTLDALQLNPPAQSHLE